MKEIIAQRIAERRRENLDALARDVARAKQWAYRHWERMGLGKAEYRLTWQQGWLYWEGDLTLRRELLGKQGEIRLIVGRAEGKP